MQLLDTLVAGVRSACAAFPDARRGDVRYSMADIGMGAVASCVEIAWLCWAWFKSGSHGGTVNLAAGRLAGCG